MRSGPRIRQHVKKAVLTIHRRFLWHVLVSYLGASWLILQVTDQAVSHSVLPNWVYVVMLVLLVLGLPLVLEAAWIESRSRPSSAVDSTLLPDSAELPVQRAEWYGHKWTHAALQLFRWKWAVGAGAFVILATITAGLLQLRSAGQPARTDPEVVAVFPFRVSGADRSLSFLRTGMIDLLAAKLTGDGGLRAADPQSVLSAWAVIALADSVDLSEDQQLRIAEELGAGRAAFGSIVGTPTNVIIEARLAVVPEGAIRAVAEAGGPADSLLKLIDRLTAELMAREAGEVESRLDMLTTTSLPALRAYLEGQSAHRQGRYADAQRHFVRALELDSTFALAGLRLPSSGSWAGEPMKKMGLEAAWNWRNRLSSRERLYLVAVVGPQYPKPSPLADYLEAWEEAADAAPDGAEAWFELGDLYFHWGAMLDIDDSHRQAATLFQRALSIDPRYASPLGHLVELSALRRDTLAVRQLHTRYSAVDSTGAVAHYLHWLVERTLSTNSGGLENTPPFFEMPRASLRRIIGTGQRFGVAVEDAVEAATILRSLGGNQSQRRSISATLHALELNRGRPGAALELTSELQIGEPLPRDYLRRRLLDALYWDGNRTAAQAATDTLTAWSDADLANTAASRKPQFADICTVAIWRLEHADTANAREAIEKLRMARIPEDGPRTVTAAATCVVMLEALLAHRQGPNHATDALASLDTLMRSGPAGLRTGPARVLTRSPGVLQTTTGLAGGGLEDFGNLIVARLHEEHGEFAKALTAARRKPYYWNATGYLSSYLRAEARLATLVGDRDGAISAYDHYLRLRFQPEQAIQDEVDRARREFARLTDDIR